MIVLTLTLWCFFANILFQKKCSKKYVPAQIAVSLWEYYYKTPVEHIKEGLHTKKPFHVPFYLLFGYEYPNPDEDDESWIILFSPFRYYIRRAASESRKSEKSKAGYKVSVTQLDAP